MPLVGVALLRRKLLLIVPLLLAVVTTVWIALGRRFSGRLPRQLPGRLGVIGWPSRLNPFLALADGRDIRYADLSELDDWRRVVRVVDHWQAEERPVFMLLPRRHRGGSPWTGYRFHRVPGTRRLVEVVSDEGGTDR